jgi:deoxyribodipyrimidine photolyase
VRRAVNYLYDRSSNCSLAPFEDWLALDRDKFTYSPVYSVFRERALKAIRKDNPWAKADIVSRPKRVKGLHSINKLSLAASVPSPAQTLEQFRGQVERGYSKSRNSFGSLFDYEQPSSSFMGLYVSAGRVSILQLLHATSDQTYKAELLWNQYCELYIEHYGDEVCRLEYGPYSRKQVKWLGAAEERQLIDKLRRMSTDEPLINSIMNQLM